MGGTGADLRPRDAVRTQFIRNVRTPRESEHRRLAALSQESAQKVALSSAQLAVASNLSNLSLDHGPMSQTMLDWEEVWSPTQQAFHGQDPVYYCDRRHSIHNRSEHSSVSFDLPTTPAGRTYDYMMSSSQPTTPCTAPSYHCTKPLFTTPCRTPHMPGQAAYGSNLASLQASKMNQLTAQASATMYPYSQARHLPVQPLSYQDLSLNPALALDHYTASFDSLNDNDYVNVSSQPSTASSCASNFEQFDNFSTFDTQSCPSSNSEDESSGTVYPGSYILPSQVSAVIPDNANCEDHFPSLPLEDPIVRRARRESRVDPYPSPSKGKVSSKHRRASAVQRCIKQEVKTQDGIPIDFFHTPSEPSTVKIPCPLPPCPGRFKRAEHLKRHVDQVHDPYHRGKKKFLCALHILGGEDTCTINKTTNTRKKDSERDKSAQTKGKGTGRPDNLNQHYATHLKKGSPNGRPRNKIVPTKFLLYCIKKHTPSRYEKVLKSLEQQFAKAHLPPKADGEPQWAFGVPDMDWVQKHPDYDAEYFDWVDEGCPPPEVEAVDGDVTAEDPDMIAYTGPTKEEEDFFAHAAMEDADPLQLERLY